MVERFGGGLSWCFVLSLGPTPPAPEMPLPARRCRLEPDCGLCTWVGVVGCFGAWIGVAIGVGCAVGWRVFGLMSLVFASPGAVRFHAVSRDTSLPVEAIGGALTSSPVGDWWTSGVRDGSVAVSVSVSSASSSLSVLPDGVDPWDPYWSSPSSSASLATSIAQGARAVAPADGPWPRLEDDFLPRVALIAVPNGAQ